MIKQKRGYSLGVLVITIAVMIILTTTALISFRGLSPDKEVTNFMNDLQEVEEYVKEYYSSKRTLPIKYDNNQNPIKITEAEYEKIRKQVDDFESGNYYFVDLAKLERIHLSDYNRGYIVNKNSLKVYTTSSINYQGTDYYTVTDEMKGQEKTYNENGDFEVVISGNPIKWTSKAKLILSVPNKIVSGDWTFKYYVDGPIKAEEFKDKGKLFLYGETVEITTNGIVSFYAENEEGYAKVVNVVVTQIDDIKPNITLSGERTNNGELLIVDNETGINPDNLYYKIVGYDDISNYENGRPLLTYGVRYTKYIEELERLNDSLSYTENKINYYRSLGSGDSELTSLYEEKESIELAITQLNDANMDMNDGNMPYNDEEPNIAIYVEDYAGNRRSYIAGVSRKVLLNSNLIDFQAELLDNSIFSIIKDVPYISGDKVYLKIRSQGATHMLITTNETISPSDIANYIPYQSSNGEYEFSVAGINGLNSKIYAYYTAGEYDEDGKLIYKAMVDTISIDRDWPTTDAPEVGITNRLELTINVKQKDNESGIFKIQYGYQLADSAENIDDYEWFDTVDELEQHIEPANNYYIRTRVTDKAGNGPQNSNYTILHCPTDKIESVPNAPRLGDMQAIRWTDNLVEVEIDEETLKDSEGNDGIWYDYVLGETNQSNTKSKWANAKSADGSYWVWIPRYGYKIVYYTDATKTKIKGYHKNSPYTGMPEYYLEDGETVSTPENVKTLYGDIDIVFLNGTANDKYMDAETDQVKSLVAGGSKIYSDYIVHPAFQSMTADDRTNQNPLGKWDVELEGIWVAKFEASRADADISSQGTSNTLKVVPNVKSLTDLNVGAMYDLALNYDVDMNSHLMKNSEWGAVAYLTHSGYGLNGAEVGINQCSSIVTGGGPSTSGATYGATTEAMFDNRYGYKTNIGMKASTTGNVYGIYDMSGGAGEYTAAYVNNGHSNISGDSHGGNLGKTTELRTKQAYKSTVTDGSDSSEADYALAESVYGDAVYETSTSYRSVYSWNSDFSNLPKTDSPIFVRGGDYSTSNTGAGVFYFSRTAGSNLNGGAFRPVLCVD